MSIVRVGSTKQFADNWEHIFAGKKAKATAKGADKKPKGKNKKSAAKASKKK